MIEKLKRLISDYRTELIRFAKFLVVGTIGAFVDFGILYILHAVLHWHLALSNTISFTTAVLSNFTWNRYWTYPDSRSKPITAQLGQFFLVNVIGWGINTGILLALNVPLTNLVGNLHIMATADMAHKIGYNAAKVIATGVVLFWNFFINRFWTYSDVGKPQPASVD